MLDISQFAHAVRKAIEPVVPEPAPVQMTLEDAVKLAAVSLEHINVTLGQTAGTFTFDWSKIGIASTVNYQYHINIGS